MILGGLDLAWGERNPDGICLLQGHPDRIRVRFIGLTHGDAALMDLLHSLPAKEGVLLAIDAPVVCPNASGSRPVDRLLQQRFRAAHAGAYPANQKLCARPLRLVKRLASQGFEIGGDPPWNRLQLMETFPHPCTLRWFDRDIIFKYKKGPVAARRSEFASLQRQLRSFIRHRLPRLAEQVEVVSLLGQPWTKGIEDQTDALICALLAYDHWFSQGLLTETLGDSASGFVVIPAEPGNPRAT